MAHIDIVIPNYNCASYLSNCINSCLNQTYKDFDIIIVDDGSTDKSNEILSNYATKYTNKIKYVSLPSNKGTAYARNIALKFTTGEYVTFLDSDDELANNKVLERVNNIINEKKPDIITLKTKFNYHGLDASFLGMKKDISQKDEYYQTKDKKTHIYESRPSVTAKFIKRDIINTEFPDGLKWEDYAFMVPYFTSSKDIYSLAEVGYIYNINPFGTTVKDILTVPKHILDIFKCTDIINSNIPEEEKEYYKEELTIVKTMNCLQRVRDLAFTMSISASDKKELAELLTNLIYIREGNYHNLDYYKFQYNNAKLYHLRMSYIESLIDFNNINEESEIVLNDKIERILKKY